MSPCDRCGRLDAAAATWTHPDGRTVTLCQRHNDAHAPGLHKHGWQRDEAPAAVELVEATNEGQLRGQLRLGGESVRAELSLIAQEAPAPRIEPAAAVELGPSLFELPGVEL